MFRVSYGGNSLSMYTDVNSAWRILMLWECDNECSRFSMLASKVSLSELGRADVLSRSMGCLTVKAPAGGLKGNAHIEIV